MAVENHFTFRVSHLRLPRVCVPLLGEDGGELVDKAEAVARDNPFVEFRLDYLQRPAQALSRIKEFTESHPHVTAVATCRRAANGGKFRGSIASELDILRKAAEAGCQLIDVELQTASRRQD